MDMAKLCFSFRISSVFISSKKCYVTSSRIKPKVKLEETEQVVSDVKEEGRSKKVRSDHVLKNLFPWKTKQQFVEHLAANVIYNEDGLVSINKPYGVPLQKKGLLTGPNESLFTIEEALIPLASLLQVEKLLPAKIPERFSSGVALFSSKEDTVQKIRRSYEINKSQKVPTFKYLAIVIGRPSPTSCKETVGLGNCEHKDYSRKLPVIVKHYSKQKVANGLIQEFKVDYKTLSEGRSPCSLVELNISSVKNYFFRVYLAHLFSPILGDHMYGNRICDIMGKRLAINPLQADGLGKFQKISPDILTILKVSEGGLVPTCLHLSQVTLSQFTSRDSNLILKANLPPHFQYVSQALQLSQTSVNQSD